MRLLIQYNGDRGGGGGGDDVSIDAGDGVDCKKIKYVFIENTVWAWIMAWNIWSYLGYIYSRTKNTNVLNKPPIINKFG